MNADRITAQGFRPNPFETVPPLTARDAFEDTIRFMATSLPKEQVRELVKVMDSDRVVAAVQGMHVRPPLSAVELMLGNTLEYCIREGLLKSPIAAICEIESVKQDVLEGGVFVT